MLTFKRVTVNNLEYLTVHRNSYICTHTNSPLFIQNQQPKTSDDYNSCMFNQKSFLLYGYGNKLSVLKKS